MKKLLAILLVSAVVLTGCGVSTPEKEVLNASNVDDPAPVSEEAEPIEEAEEAPEEEAPKQQDGVYQLGDTFIYDDLEITFGTDITWHTVDNQFADEYGMDVFAIPIKIKNLSDETQGLSSSDFTPYGSKGTRGKEIGSYFENSVTDNGKMRSGAEQDALLYLLYDGDGAYFLEFSTYSDKLEVEIPVTK